MTGGPCWCSAAPAELRRRHDRRHRLGLDEDGTFVREQRYHPEFLSASSLADDPESAAQVYELMTLHAATAHSQRAEVLLVDWKATQRMLVKLAPRPQA